MVVHVKIIWDLMIVSVKLDGLGNIVKIVNIVNQTHARMEGHVSQHKVAINVCVIDSREKTVINLIRATQILVKMVDNAATLMGHQLALVNQGLPEISAKLIIVLIAIQMPTV